MLSYIYKRINNAKDNRVHTNTLAVCVCTFMGACYCTLDMCNSGSIFRTNIIEMNITLHKHMNAYDEGLNARQLVIKAKYEPSIEVALAEMLEQA